MGRQKIHEFYPYIYPRRVWVVRGLNQNEIQDFLSLRNGDSIVFDDTEGNEPLCTVFPYIKLRENGKYGILVLISEKISVSDIAHESTHVAMEIFNDLGAIITYDNQEPFAYLVGWVADCINQVRIGKFKY